MRAVVQRVLEARVHVGDQVVGAIGPGLCVLLGVGRTDSEKHAEALADKLKNLRIFADAAGKMNVSAVESGGEVLVVSQFTLYGDCRKGNRPSFTEAASTNHAERLYGSFVARLRAAGLRVATGRFQAHMNVAIFNDGPVTFVIENS